MKHVNNSMNIYFAQMTTDMPEGSSHFWGYLPYSVGCIWAYAQTNSLIKEKYTAKEFLVMKEDPDQLVANLESPKVFCFSDYVWNHNYNLLLAQKVKEKHPDCVIVFGGPSVPTKECEQFMAQHEFIDYAVLNEGEISFQNLLLHMLGEPSDLGGVWCRHDNKDFKPAQRIHDLTPMPSPYTLGLFDDLVKKYQGTNVTLNAIIETNRGCPFKCTFCDWGNGTLGKVKTMDMERVTQEIEWCGKNNIEFVTFADANFGAFKKRDMEISHLLAATKEKYGYPKTMSVSWHKNMAPAISEIASVLLDAGLLRRFAVGFQTLTDNALLAIKRTNIVFDTFMNVVKACEEKNVPVAVDLMAPLPGDTAKEFRNTMDFFYDIDVIPVISPTVVLPNAEMYESEYQKQHGLVWKENSTGNNPWTEEIELALVQTNTMTQQEFNDVFVLAYAVESFHSYGFTDLVAKYYRKKYDMKFTTFYDMFWKYFMQNNFHASKYFHRYRNHVDDKRTSELYGSVYLLKMFNDLGKENRELFYAELKKFVKENLPNDENLDALINLQYNWQNHEHSSSRVHISCNNNLFDYITSDTELVEKATKYTAVASEVDKSRWKDFGAMLMGCRYNREWAKRILKSA